MEERDIRLPHKFSVEERKRMNLTGAKEVIHFDEELVELDTGLGRVVIQGEGLRLKCLSLEDGAVVIQGKICSVTYEDAQKRRGLFR